MLRGNVGSDLRAAGLRERTSATTSFGPRISSTVHTKVAFGPDESQCRSLPLSLLMASKTTGERPKPQSAPSTLQ
jgi:hypothetical protein